MKKKFAMTMVSLALTTALMTGCTMLENIKQSNDPVLKQWRLVEESAFDSQVVMYVSDLDEKQVNWLNNEFKTYLKESKKIDLVVETLDFERTIQKLKSDKLNQVLIGQMDLIVLPEDGFKRGYDNGLWYGPFTSDMPLLKNYVDLKNLNFQFEEGLAASGRTLPFAQEQLVMVYDRDVFFDAPTNWTAFFEAVKEYRGTFTYPDPRLSRIGEAFVLSYLLHDQHLEDYMKAPMDKAFLEKNLKGKLQKLADLKPFMYEKGEKYPQSVAELDQLFSDGKLLFSMTMDYNHTTKKLADYQYPEGAYSYVFDEGTLSYNKNMTIAHNAPNKSGAMVVLQALLEGDMQASQYDPKKVGALPMYTPGVTAEEHMKKVEAVRLKPTSVKAKELLSKQISEIPKVNRKAIIQLWEEVVFSSGDK